MAFYVIAPLVAMLPGVTFNSESFTVMIDLNAAALAISVALAGVAAVFKTWGKK